MKLFRECTRRLGDALARTDDTTRERQRKVAFLLFNVVGFVCAGWGLNVNLSQFGKVPLYAALVFHAVQVLSVVALKNVSQVMLVAQMAFSTIGLAWLDVEAMAIFRRSWPFFILLFDFLLVMNAPRWLTNGLVACVCVHLFVCEMELHVRFGLLDLPGQFSYDQRREAVECAAPPCAQNDWLRFLPQLLPPLVTFLVDVLLTQQFAEKVAKHTEALEKTIAAAESITQLLADYELAAARDVMGDMAGDLPPEFLESFHSLVDTLESHRPYLPGEFFLTPQSPNELCCFSDTCAIPGVGDCNAAIVFTDIRSSTALWEASGDAMLEALGMHNTIVRRWIQCYRGYEVKTIGDSFMIAFSDAEDAVAFGLHVQTDLANCKWPEELTRPNANDGFDMLSIRIGVNYDEVAAEKNVLTGRYDYFGRMVNKAARVESHGISGAVTVTDEVMRALRDGELLDSAFVIPYAEERTGKGLSEPLQLTAVLPRVLGTRVAHVREQAGRSNPGRQASRQASARASIGISDVGSMPRSPASSAAMSEICIANSPPRVVGARAASGGSATVGFIKFAFWDRDDPYDAFDDIEQHLTDRLQTLYTYVHATRGVVSSVLHTSVLVSWGLHAKCPQHMNESTRFAFQYWRHLRADAVDAQPLFHGGLVTGPLASARVTASTKQCFLTLVGPVVDLAQQLCAAAAELRTCVLAASLEDAVVDRHEASEILGPHVRPVDKWTFGNLPAGMSNGVFAGLRDLEFYVMEMNLRTLAETAEECYLPEMLRENDTSIMARMVDANAPTNSRGGWDRRYSQAFRRRDMDELRQIARWDAGVDRILRMMAAGQQLSHALIGFRSRERERPRPPPVSVFDVESLQNSVSTTRSMCTDRH